jgi:hypothetical protein
MLLMLLSCGGPGVVPEWKGDIWPGRPDIGGVSRIEDGGFERRMLATDPQFKKGAWISYDDIGKFFVMIQSCKSWRRGTPMMSPQEALKRMQPVIDYWQAEAQEANQAELDQQISRDLDTYQADPAPKE